MSFKLRPYDMYRFVILVLARTLKLLIVPVDLSVLVDSEEVFQR